MPKPISIICAESGAVDKETGAVSLFRLIESIAIVKVQPQEAGAVILVPKMTLFITSLWMKEEADEGVQFEFKTVAMLPPDGSELQLASGEFSFAKQFHRLMTRLEGPLPFEGPGTLRIAMRVSRKSGGDATTQEYPILVREQSPQSDA